MNTIRLATEVMMLRMTRPTMLRYGLAILMVGIILLLTSTTRPLGESRVILPNFPSHAEQSRSENSQDQTVKLGTELVSVHVTVTDHSGRAIEGLNKENFRIYEDKVEQQISFFSNEDAPASIGVVFDTSNSMSGSKIMHAQEALERFIQTSHQEDEFFLISFSSTPKSC